MPRIILISPLTTVDSYTTNVCLNREPIADRLPYSAIQPALHDHGETKWPLCASSNASTILQLGLPSLGHVRL